MKEEIVKRIDAIEIEEKVKVFYACESGSRAWGFPSSDSDYDIRFIYLHRKDWYLSVDLERKSDVIERPINDRLDISGWDLRKALKLLRNSNPPLMEWLSSPIIYREQFSVATQMRELLSQYYSPLACLYHYLHMAQGNYRTYLKGSTVWVKKYFYVLRPLLAISWIERDLGVVPTEFEILVDKVVDSPKLAKEIEQLIASKRRGDELDYGPHKPLISDFLEKELARLESVRFGDQYTRHTGPIHEYNRVFTSALEEVW